jgi:hypothetical protein
MEASFMPSADGPVTFIKTFADEDLFTTVLEDSTEDWWVNGTTAAKDWAAYIKAWRMHEMKIGVSCLNNAL